MDVFFFISASSAWGVILLYVEHLFRASCSETTEPVGVFSLALLAVLGDARLGQTT